MEGIIGEIRMFAGNFAPRGWFFCDGRHMEVSNYLPLHAVIGSTYGGDNKRSFFLPDLRSRVPVHPGRGPGLSERRLGERFGKESPKSKEIKVALAENDAGVEINESENSVIQPSLGINFIICVNGTFPSRN